MTNDSRSKVEIHLKRGIKMDIVTDAWIRRCIGIAVVLGALSVFTLAATPLVSVIKWW